MIPRPNHENHVILRILARIMKKNESLIIPYKKNENHEFPRIPNEKN